MDQEIEQKILDLLDGDTCLGGGILSLVHADLTIHCSHAIDERYHLTNRYNVIYID